MNEAENRKTLIMFYFSYIYNYDNVILLNKRKKKHNNMIFTMNRWKV